MSEYLSYDFKAYFSQGRAGVAQVQAFIEDDNFVFNVIRVEPNPYLSAGQKPQGERDTSFCYTLEINHKDNPSSGRVLLSRDDLDSPFTTTFYSDLQVPGSKA